MDTQTRSTGFSLTGSLDNYLAPRDASGAGRTGEPRDWLRASLDYYLCLNAQRKGWAVCPAKSLPAQAIEESVLGRIREGHQGIFEPAEWDQLDRAQQVEAMQSTVARIGYDGTARQVSIRFHAEAQA